MRSWLQRHPLTAFFLLAFGVAWVGWIGLALYWQQVPSARPTNPVAALAPFAFAPTLAAFAMAGITDGRAGVRALLQRLVAWRFSLRWYLFVLLSPAGLLVAGAAAGALGAGRSLDFSATMAATQYSGISPWVLAPIVFVLGFLGGPLNEELGWRGFALPRLQARHSPFVASVILGLLWGPWHLPLFFVPGMIQATLPMGAFMASVLVNTFFYTWAHNRTGGSLLPAVLLHNAFNSSTAFVPVLPTDWWVIGLSALVVAAIIATGPRHWFAGWSR